MILKIFITIICFFGGAFLGFFIYSFVIAYLIEQNLPNKEIAVGLLETTKMIFLIGSLRMGELEEYIAPTITIISSHQFVGSCNDRRNDDEKSGRLERNKT